MKKSEQSLLLKFIQTLSLEDEKETEEVKEDDFISPKNIVSELQKRIELIKEKNYFKIGDIVVWKEGLRNKRFPDYEQPSIVTKILDPILTDDENVGYGIEKLDIEIAFITEENNFLFYNYDSARFKKYKTDL